MASMQGGSRCVSLVLVLLACFDSVRLAGTLVSFLYQSCLITRSESVLEDVLVACTLPRCSLVLEYYPSNAGIAAVLELGVSQCCDMKVYEYCVV